MALPDTHFLLEYIRPDLLLLRVLSRALILWDEVKPTADWIDDQIPIVVRESYQQMRSIVEGASNFSSISNLGSNGTDADGETADTAGDSTTGRNAATFSFRDESVDKQAVRQIYVHIIAGACFGIGLRFAGTGDERAASAVSDRLAELKLLREGNDPVSAALRPELQILEMCIGCVAISLAMIMAGTGDLDTFRVLRTIRWRCDDDIGYGSHMAYGAAIGLLFLGGGSYTLGRSPEDIAALVMAFFPRLPSTTSDNQHHLQALRHCYVLAIEKRELRAVDSDTGAIVSVPVEVSCPPVLVHVVLRIFVETLLIHLFAFDT
jgi:anaphase-promoting complex subunit 1